MPQFAHVIWDLPDDDLGNVQHIADNGLTPEEVEDVLLDPGIKATRSRSSSRPIVFGYTRTGRYIAVVYDVIDPLTARPVTAYEVEE
jgi:uncharacterized DUF497 family protein